MGSSKDRSSSAARHASADDGFEELREAFRTRLQSESVHFVTLSAALAHAEDNAVGIFDDLQCRAHELCGGATIFAASDVAAAAHALERAAIHASQSRADHSDAAVWSSLVALVQLMTEMGGGARAPG